MHFFKLLGAVLIFGCGVLLGMTLARFERARARQGQGFLALLCHIRAQIDCFSIPLGRILASCDEKILADCGVEATDIADLKTLLDGTRLYLGEEACRLLLDFSERLGSSYREEQLRCCDYYIRCFTPVVDRLRAELPKRERMALFLPMALSAALLLLLI